MRKLHLISLALILCLCSCKEKTSIDRNAKLSAQNYPWNIALPDAESWVSSDRIGVFMHSINGHIVNGVDNIECRPTGQGMESMFEPVNPDHKITFPNNTVIYFLAYAPYKSKDQINEYRIAVDITNQSDQKAIDYTCGPGNYYTYPLVKFSMEHMMTRIQTNLTSSIYSPEQMKEATVKLKGIPTKGVFLIEKSIVIPEQEIGDVQTKVINDGERFQAIVFPGNLEKLNPQIEVSIAGKTLVCDIYEPQFQNEREYRFSLDLLEESIYYAPPINSKRQ